MTTILDPGKIYEKYIQGESLSDAEISFGVDYYSDLANKLFKCGPAFSIAFVEANRIYMRLEDMQIARLGR
jgi:hypothetical protein